MKKTIVFLVALTLLLSGQFVFASQGNNGLPFKELWGVFEEKISLLKIDLESQNQVLDERITVLEEKLAQCGCGEVPELGECSAEEVNLLLACQAYCEPVDLVCNNICALDLSLECQGAYQQLNQCSTLECYFYTYDGEALNVCLQERCSELYDAVYDNYNNPVCGDNICNISIGENYENCLADCTPPENISCGQGACAVTVPFGEECIPNSPEDELCDGVDNDCDGEVDEDSSGAPEDECQTEWVCDSGSELSWVCLDVE